MADVDIDSAALERVLLAARRDAMEDAAPRLLASSMDECPVGETRNLRRSHEINWLDFQFYQVLIEALAEYAAAVHEGARPHDIPNAFGRGDTVWHPGNEANTWMRRAIDRETV